MREPRGGGGAQSVSIDVCPQLLSSFVVVPIVVFLLNRAHYDVRHQFIPTNKEKEYYTRRHKKNAASFVCVPFFTT